MKNFLFSIRVLRIFVIFFLLTPSLTAQILSGRVYEGDEGIEPPTSTALAGVTVSLYESNDASSWTFIRSTTTDGTGWYGLEVESGFTYFRIIETNPSGYTSDGATSVGGTVISDDIIQYTAPLAGKTLTGNKFWDKLPAPANNPPVADANGPYTGLVNQNVTLDGTGSYDPDGDTITYLWDFDNDGQYDDAIVSSPTYQWSTGGTKTIKLLVTDIHGDTDTDQTTATIRDTGGQTGNITIIKAATPPDSSVSFTYSGDLGSFTLSPGSNQIQFNNLTPGNYQVTETLPTDWALGNYQISGDLDGGTTHDSLTATFDIDLDSGESISLVIYNYKLGSIIIEKQTSPGGTTEIFTFRGDLGSFTLSDNETLTFQDLVPGLFTILEDVLSGWTLTNISFDDLNSTDDLTIRTASISLEAGETVRVVFTNTRMDDQLGSMGDWVWNDVNQNGIQDAGETGLPGITVELLDATGNMIASTQTDGNGYYLFFNLNPATYSLRFTLPSGYAFSPADQGSDDTVDSDANPATGETVPYALSAGEHSHMHDAGMYQSDDSGVFDYGDAPSPYPTLLSDNGARHRIGGAWLGDINTPPDTESDGQPHSYAVGDDNLGIDDEDGVGAWHDFVIGDVCSLSVIPATPGYLNVWVDLNLNGSWAESIDHVIGNHHISTLPVSHPWVKIPFSLPNGTESGDSFMRVRYSTQPGLSYVGEAQDGEVEDHLVSLDTRDFGDAPSPYPTTRAGNGLSFIAATTQSHWLYIALGDSVDGEYDAVPNQSASGDDTGGYDDEDGVQFLTPFIRGNSVQIRVTFGCDEENGSKYLGGWIDFNQDGDWSDAGEKVISRSFSHGWRGKTTDTFTVTVPNSAQTGTTYARFSFSYEEITDPTGARSEPGEVEDYKIIIVEDIGGDPGGIRGRVWDDLNKDGIQDTGESGINNIWVDIRDKNGNPWMGTSTNTLGEYEIPNLPPGNDYYYITFIAPTGHVFSPWHQGGDPTKDSDAHPSGQTDLITVVSGIWTESIDAGLYQLDDTDDLDFGDAQSPYPDANHHAGTAWFGDGSDQPDTESSTQADANALGDDNDGNDDEDGLINCYLVAGQTGSIMVEVHASASTTFRVTNWIDFNQDGDWDDTGENVADYFLAISPGQKNYVVWSVTVPASAVAGMTISRFRIYNDTSISPSPSGYGGPGEVCDHEIEIKTDGDPGPGGGLIIGYKWNDLDGNGLWDAGEPGLSNWTIWLDANQNGVEDIGDQYAQTNAHGFFTFSGLAIGHYLVGEEIPPGWIQTWPGSPNIHTVTVQPTQPSVGILFGNRRSGDGDGLGARKWSQPPLQLEIPEQDTACYWGWLERSIDFQPVYADDWFCYDPRPVTAIKWWGGYADWDSLVPPPIAPEAFHIGVWTDVSKGVDREWSHPGILVHEWTVERILLNETARRCIFMPGMVDEPITGFEYLFQIPEDWWFHQEGDSTLYWLSITAYYDKDPEPNHWGWLTREHYFHDDAVRFYLEMPVHLGDSFVPGEIVYERWDLAYELGTDEYLREFDYGDAPETDYPTLLENNGAHHRVVPSVRLGARVDVDEDGQPDVAALGDDNDGQDDEDGVQFTETLTIGNVHEVTIQVSTSGFLNVWLDIDRDGTWIELYDHVIRNTELQAGEHKIPVEIPEEAEPGETIIRFRFSREPDLWFNGFAMDGEVEDYIVTIQSGTPVERTPVPIEYRLFVNYPNPFNPSTRITFALPVRAKVTLEIFNIAGERVRTLVNGKQESGIHAVEWDARDDAGNPVTTGIYICRFSTPDRQQMIRMLFLK